MRIIETKRLFLREYEESDFDKFAEMYADEEVMKFIGEGNAVKWNKNDKENLRKKNKKWYTEWGFGLWTLIEKESNSVIGNCGFVKLQNSEEVEITYLLAKKYWGKGYATEISKATLQYGISKLNLKRIVALVYPENIASINIISKLGMKPEGEKEFFGKNILYFAVESELNKDIYTARTRLRKYEETDKFRFAEIFTDKEVNKFMGGQHCANMEDAFNLFDKCREIYRGLLTPRHFEIWAIEFEGKLIGHFELKQTPNTADGEVETVYLLDKDYWGRGLMGEILNGVNLYANQSGKQVIATVNTENDKTMRLLMKMGIEKEGWIEDEEGKTYKIWLKKNTGK